jgi:hypothetical protein
MLPITAWKSVLLVTAFLAVPAAIFLPKHAAVPAAAFTAGQDSTGAESQYPKPSPFTTPAPKTHRHQKPVAVAANPILPDSAN